MESAIHDVDMTAGSSPSPDSSGRNLPVDGDQINPGDRVKSKSTDERSTDEFSPLVGRDSVFT